MVCPGYNQWEIWQLLFSHYGQTCQYCFHISLFHVHLDSILTSAVKLGSLLQLTDGSLCSLSPRDKEKCRHWIFYFLEYLNHARFWGRHPYF
uniref:Uncharacterized protein n=1 Tax=Anolis carolinensis TaxID=28377 RepID=A0A803T777_ANOCA